MSSEKWKLLEPFNKNNNEIRRGSRGELLVQEILELREKSENTSEDLKRHKTFPGSTSSSSAVRVVLYSTAMDFLSYTFCTPNNLQQKVFVKN